MQKARSRLANKQQESEMVIPQKYVTTAPVVKTEKPPRSTTTTINHKRIQYLPLCILSLISFLFILFICLKVPPAQLQNILIPNSYLPFILLCFCAIFFFFSYLLLNTRRALLISSYLILWLIFQLQQIEVDWGNFFKITVFFLAVTVFSELLNSRQSSSSQTSKH